MAHKRKAKVGWTVDEVMDNIFEDENLSLAREGLELLHKKIESGD